MIMMRAYEVSIYGRANSIFTGIRDELLYANVIRTMNKKEAVTAAWRHFNTIGEHPWLKRKDVRIECDRV